MNKTEILVRDGRTSEILFMSPTQEENDYSCEVATIVSNMAHYGFVLSQEAYGRLSKMYKDVLIAFWNDLEPVLKKITGDDIPMGEFVVYKNFPDEVMSMDEGQYWTRQILMYMGFDKAYFTQAQKSREDIDISKLNLAVLQLATPKDCERILRETSGMQAEWNEDQFVTVSYLVFQEQLAFDLADVPFKGNMARIMGAAINLGVQLEARTATDVLRVATAMSDGDTRFVTSTRFKRFTRRERRGLLGMLNNCENLDEDAFRHVERFKRFLHGLHPNDYAKAFPRPATLQGLLRNNERPTTFNSILEKALGKKDKANAITLLSTRPGEFARRLRYAVELFGMQAARAFIYVADRLSTQRLLELRNNVLEFNNRKSLIYPPKGQWAKAQFIERGKKEFLPTAVTYLTREINNIISVRLSDELPEGVFDLDARLSRVRLPNGGDLLPFGRGTEFEIPDDVNFIRTASYWKLGPGQGAHNIWYDNGFNFFDENWAAKGNISWNNPKPGKWAAFSGDPCSSKTPDGQATQVIDLYIDELVAQGIRYAVWNVLCFSNLPFSKAVKVQAGMQWGDDAKKGKLFEPSRNVMNFPLTGEGKTKYIAMLDVSRRTIMYLDANLAGCVSSAGANDAKLAKMMPAFMEYINTLPSVLDLFELASFENSTFSIKNSISVLYDDREEPVTGTAYVFKQVNEESKFESFDMTDLLNSKTRVKEEVNS